MVASNKQLHEIHIRPIHLNIDNIPLKKVEIEVWSQVLNLISCRWVVPIPSLMKIVANYVVDIEYWEHTVNLLKEEYFEATLVMETGPFKL